MGCRSVNAAAQLKSEILALNSGVRPDNLLVEKLDLTDFASIAQFAANVPASDTTCLINNAAYAGPKALTLMGIDMTFMVNHLGPFALTHLLLNRVTTVVNVASRAHERVTRVPQNLDFSDMQYSGLSTWGPNSAYPVSKLYNVATTLGCHRRYSGHAEKPRRFNCVHPGVVQTLLFDHLPRPLNWLLGFHWFGASRLLFDAPALAAERVLQALDAPISGAYFSGGLEAPPNRLLDDRSWQDALWQLSWDAVQPHLKLPYV
jgi:NAD(P)-dependent dehydrogenase (short-subunit alcohol dehydrogenase family)